MRKELYKAIKKKLGLLCRNDAGEFYFADEDMNPALIDPVIKHIDLWNRNVEFIDQEIPSVRHFGTAMVAAGILYSF